MSATADLYEQDFYAWTMKNAELLRRRQLTEVDLEHLAEELESMGKSERRELMSRLTQLLLHLLKWRLQPALRTRSWLVSIQNQRIAIGKLLKDSPSLKAALEPFYAEAYADAVSLAEAETGIDRKDFPASCPFTLEQALSDRFLPGEHLPP